MKQIHSFGLFYVFAGIQFAEQLTEFERIRGIQCFFIVKLCLQTGKAHDFRYFLPENEQFIGIFADFQLNSLFAPCLFFLYFKPKNKNLGVIFCRMSDMANRQFMFEFVGCDFIPNSLAHTLPEVPEISPRPAHFAVSLS